MSYPNIGKVQIKKRTAQAMQIRGINLTDNYADGQMESSKNISSDRFPYITTAQKRTLVDTGIPEGYHAVSMFAWEKLFVVSNEPATGGGYKCYYGGQYIGDADNLTVPKQYAVVNSKLVVWPDKVYFDLYEEDAQSHKLTTAPKLVQVNSGSIVFRKEVDS